MRSVQVRGGLEAPDKRPREPRRGGVKHRRRSSAGDGRGLRTTATTTAASLTARSTESIPRTSCTVAMTQRGTPRSPWARRGGPRDQRRTISCSAGLKMLPETCRTTGTAILQQSTRRDKLNLQFYLGMTRSVPDGVSIDGFHQDWYKDYDRLESVHSYIQWLFPLQEPGMNRDASILTTEEIEEFLQSNIAKENLLKSYKLMLDFYGIELSDEKTGEVRRACNWRDRFNNLNRRTHNNLRITRILKCLGTLGYRHYQAPLVHFFLKETLVHRELPQVRDSVLHYFVFAVLDKRERRRLLKFAYLSYDRREEFVWCPKKIQIKWSQGMSSRTELLHCEDGRQEEED
uniref:Opioid growth factor receptor 2 n=1 Tax=Gasterosteus aculeatus aculeatus TaxID=481459 RepID=A0AAQ4S7I9_GASAC